MNLEEERPLIISWGRSRKSRTEKGYEDDCSGCCEGFDDSKRSVRISLVRGDYRGRGWDKERRDSGRVSRDRGTMLVELVCYILSMPCYMKLNRRSKYERMSL